MAEPRSPGAGPGSGEPPILLVRRVAARFHAGLVVGVAVALLRGARSSRCAVVLVVSTLALAGLHVVADRAAARRAERRRERDGELDAQEEARAEIVTTMSHEIRTAMNAIFGITEMIADDPGVEGAVRGLVARVRAAARIVLSLVDETLEVARNETWRVAPARSPFDVAATVHGVADLFAPLAAAGGVRLDCRIDPEVPGTVRGDAEHVRQIVANLVSNAVKVTRQGAISVDLEVVRRGRDDILLRAVVRDTGPGIPADQQARIFEPWVQARPGDRRIGTGLGLAIARRLTERMGGAISVESEPGRGSTFTVLLPLECPTASTGHPHAADDVAASRASAEPLA